MSRYCTLFGCITAAWGALALCANAEESTSRPANQGAGPAASQPAETPSESREQDAAPRKALLDFQSLRAELGLEATWDQNKSRFETRDRFRWTYHQTNRATRIEESIGLRARGTLVDPRIAEFDAAVRTGWRQERFFEARPGPDQSDDPHGNLLDYDVTLTLLPRGQLSGSVFAQRIDSRVPRQFLPSLDRTRERYGGGLYLAHPTFPARLTFEHERDALAGRTRDLLDDEQRGHDRLEFDGTWQISEQHALTLNYQYEDRREEYSGSSTRFDTTRHDLTLNHVLRFGLDQRSSWETMARFQQENGDLARDITDITSRLRLQWTDALSSHGSVQYLRESYEDLSSESWRGEAGLTHQLGETLTTTAQLYGLTQRNDESADFREWGGLANAAFTQPNQWGRLSANLSYNHATTDTRHGARRGIVIGEAVTLRDPLPGYLAHRDVDVLSILVTDTGRTRIYLPVRDYVVTQVGGYAALHRVPTGAIADRQAVLVTYTYKVFGDYDVDRDRVDFRIQQAFDFGLTPYYAVSLQDEDLDRPRYLTYRARNVNRQRLGATYRQRSWSAGLEYEYNDDALDPYQAVHANGDVVLWRTARQQLDGKTTLSRFWFDGADELDAHNTTLWDVGCSHRYLLARDLEATASALYRFETDSDYGDTHGVDLSAAVEWKIGLFALRLEAEYDLLDLPGSSDRTFAVWFKLRRDIPILPWKQP